VGHYIQRQHIDSLSTKFCCMVWIIREVNEIQLHPNIMNREDGLVLSKSQNALIHIRISGGKLHAGIHNSNIMAHFRANTTMLSIILHLFSWLTFLFPLFILFLPCTDQCLLSFPLACSAHSSAYSTTLLLIAY